MGRTNIVIDDDLIAEAMKITGAKSKREAVDLALRHVVDRSGLYKAIRKARGKLPWAGDILAWRKARA